MNTNQSKNRSVRRTRFSKRTILEMDELRNEVFTVGGSFNPMPKLRKVRFVYALPAITAGKAEVYLDEADLVAVIE